MSIEKYGKTQIFSGKQHVYSYFQTPSENSASEFLLTEQNAYILSFISNTCIHMRVWMVMGGGGGMMGSENY